MCSHESGCTSPVCAHELCQKHYKQAQRTGAIGATCSVVEDNEACPNGVYSDGYCEKHHRRFTLYGNPLHLELVVDHPSVCDVPGCTGTYKGHPKPYEGFGYCGKHLERWKKYGDPEATKSPGRKRKYPTICQINTIEGPCLRASEIEGHCRPHYHRLQNFGDALAGPPLGQGEPPPKCISDGCPHPAVRDGRCRKHERRHRVYREDGARCTKPDCPNASVSRGMCQTHYQEWYKHEREVPICNHPDGCTERSLCKGLCRRHYEERRIKRTNS